MPAPPDRTVAEPPLQSLLCRARLTRRTIAALSVLAFPLPTRSAVFSHGSQPTDSAARSWWLANSGRQPVNPDETAFVWQAVLEILGFTGLPSSDAIPERVQTAWWSPDDDASAAAIILIQDRAAADDLFRVTVDVMPSRRLRRDMLRVRIDRMTAGTPVPGATAHASATGLERRILDRAFALRSNARQADPARWPRWPGE
ncbi:hypothetical protein Rmf_08040 [Roseomonas fluvialis]|uniref:DUF3576 domain-containing protein n=1 Tax=Roseomonas fluvialis TaxID=1750527 RepID=A0ABM7XZH1_9PROT|nr:hypothetical protein Rmf_08040 [Roseomonas fluvialis]